ncbi:MAG TPA: PP2C family protein-serine/threonine phosphatase [Streptosporangiaceae bacterium]|nr:PP2C family protein-serine/threonine phosphatase [Streptosporangiaceae bacterium]
MIIATLAAGPDSGLLPLLSLGPAIAAVSSTLRTTVLVGAIALVLCGLLAAYQAMSTPSRDVLDSATVAGVTVAAVIGSTVRQRRERELAEVRAIAEVAQQVLLGPVPETVSDVHLAVRYLSATSQATIGGDLYEVVVAPDRVRLIIGDVQGKGLLAVKTAATVLGAFREAAHDAIDLYGIAGSLEVSLRRQLTAEQFVTAILAEVSSDGSKIELLNCGHPPPLLIQARVGLFIESGTANLPLGLADLGPVRRQSETIPVGPGDQVLFYTDGVSEARNKAGAFYPLSRSARFGSAADPDLMLDMLQEDVLDHVGHALDDDAAMLLVRREPDPAKERPDHSPHSPAGRIRGREAVPATATATATAQPGRGSLYPPGERVRGQGQSHPPVWPQAPPGSAPRYPSPG